MCTRKNRMPRKLQQLEHSFSPTAQHFALLIDGPATKEPNLDSSPNTRRQIQHGPVRLFCFARQYRHNVFTARWPWCEVVDRVWRPTERPTLRQSPQPPVVHAPLILEITSAAHRPSPRIVRMFDQTCTTECRSPARKTNPRLALASSHSPDPRRRLSATRRPTPQLSASGFVASRSIRFYE